MDAYPVDDPNIQPTSETYKGRQIVLIPSFRKENGKWDCGYRISERGPTEYGSYSGNTEASFEHPGEAKLTALQLAKNRIDSC